MPDNRRPADRNTNTRNAARAKKAKQMRTRRIITCAVLLLVVILIIVLCVQGCKKADVNGSNAGKPNIGVTDEKDKTNQKGDPNEVVAEANVVNTGDILIHQMLLDNSKS